MESAADRLNRAISLNNNAYALSNEGKLDLAMELWVQSAMGGVPNALASYLWYALKTGKHTDAIKLYESCIEEIDFSIDPGQKSNCESNYALNLVAATENTSLGDAIWMRNSESGHLESKFFALQCAIMDDSAEREKLLVERISLSEFKLITTGIRVEIPYGYEIQVRPRSGLAKNHGITVLNSPGTIDADYRGEIGVILINHGQYDFEVKPGDRIAQLVLCPVEKVQWLATHTLGTSTKRGDKGFGSTGK